MNTYVKPTNYVLTFSDFIENQKQEQPKELTWYVLDFSNGGINLLNVIPLIKKDLAWRKDLDINNFDAFSKEMCHVVMYLFHGRSEFEQYLTDNMPCIDKGEINRLIEEREKSPSNYRYHVQLSWGEKIDVAFQIFANWNAFISYMWRHKNEL